VRPVRPLDEAVLTTWNHTTGHRRKRGLSKFRSRSLPRSAKDRQPEHEKVTYRAYRAYRALLFGRPRHTGQDDPINCLIILVRKKGVAVTYRAYRAYRALLFGKAAPMRGKTK
jgi:hypothetical protein